MYNMSWTDTTSTLPDATMQVNILTGGLFGSLILLAIFVIILASFAKNHELIKVLLADSFLTAVLSVIFWVIGIVPLSIISIPTVLLIVSIVYYFWSD
jgi:hypothetical protein